MIFSILRETLVKIVIGTQVRHNLSLIVLCLKERDQNNLKT